MSRTRHAAEDSEFRQERYMSSPELNRGLLANCVAARIQTLRDPEHRKLVWWLQKVSWQHGGLDKLAAEIIQRWPERFETKAMQQLGTGPGRIYSAEECRKVRQSCDSNAHDKVGTAFPLRSDVKSLCLRRLNCEDFLDVSRIHEYPKWSYTRQLRAASTRAARRQPDSYPASAFSEYCLKEAKAALGRFLFERLCLDPAVEINEDALWYFPGLADSLSGLYAIHAAEASERAPVTEIGTKIEEALDYAIAERGLVVVDGVARIGKTFSVKAWCEAHPGQARYIQVPSSNDDMSFYRAICEGLGLGSARSYKALELRAKIEDTVAESGLILVFDEGHYLWPVRNQRRAAPHRINWILTQLVNMGVPVAIITTPQFTRSQQAVEKNGWSSEQLIGRILHYERLPDKLTDDDLGAVAGYWMPSGDEEAIGALIDYAKSSAKYLQAVEALVKCSRYLASKKGRAEPTYQDVLAALNDGVIPSDNALAAALSGARPAGRRKAACSTPAAPLKAPCTPRSRAGNTPCTAPADSTFTPPSRDTGSAVLSP
jgi:hypothetical protein